MPTPFDVQAFVLDEFDYITKMNKLVTAFGQAVNVLDIAGYVAAGGDPAQISITVFKNGTLGPYQVPGRLPATAAGQPVDKMDLSTLINQSSILALQGVFAKGYRN